MFLKGPITNGFGCSSSFGMTLQLQYSFTVLFKVVKASFGIHTETISLKMDKGCLFFQLEDRNLTSVIL